MLFSKRDMRVISQLGNGNREVSKIAKSLKISSSQVYRIAQKLSMKDILDLKKGILLPEKKTHISMLLQLLSDAENLSRPLSGTGLQIYLALLEPRTVKEVEKETGLHKTTIIKKINQGRKMSLLIIKHKRYRINEKLWLNLREFLQELKKYEESVDNRIPINSVIYFKTGDEILFSIKKEIAAEKTAFSSYEKYGIKLLLLTNYYYLPKKQLTIEEVFTHSLRVVEKKQDTRNLIFVALFLAKYKNKLIKIRHPVVENLNKIFSGEEIPGYPSLAEIKDRASIYKIKV